MEKNINMKYVEKTSNNTKRHKIAKHNIKKNKLTCI